MLTPLFAALPFFQLGVYDLPLGSWTLPIDSWATLVCIGFVVGLEVARWRGMKLGLDVRDVVDGAVFIVVMGFVIAHIFTVLFYFPERLETDGIWAILRFWEGFSSTGGFIGAVFGAWLFYKVLRPREALRHADVITFGFPVGWMFGRLGCFSVHDHVGAETTFFLAMEFPANHWAAGVRHELGLYEALFMMPVAAAFFYLGRKDRPPGFFLALFGLVYAPMRLFLDSLRNVDLTNQDARYPLPGLGWELTPAQYWMVVMFFAAGALLVYLQRQPFEPRRLDGSGRLVSAPDGSGPVDGDSVAPEDGDDAVVASVAAEPADTSERPG